MLTKHHMRFINRRPIEKFCKENGIKYSGFDLDELVENLNKALDAKKIDKQKFNKKLYEWLLQGQKKCIFSYLYKSDLNTLCNLKIAQMKINETFELSKEIPNIFYINTTTEKPINLIDINYIIDEEDKTKVKKIIFFFTHLVNNIIKGEEQENKTPMALPVHVILNFDNSEIISRVSTKTKIYDIYGDFIKDIDIARKMLEYVANKLKLNINKDNQVEYLKKTIYNVHEKLTELPKEIYNKINLLESKINLFIEEAANEIEVKITPYNEDDIKSSIENVFIKEILKTYDGNDKSIFIKNKFGFSTSIIASGKSLSKIQHTSSKHVPIHSLPEYQNTRSIIGETREISKNVVYWVSILKKEEVIRGKLYLNQDGYGIVSFEMYVLEEEMKNVFSKIRSLKPKR